MEVKNEEEEAQPSNIVAREPRRPTPDHPPYAEMVRVALQELAEEGGFTEASISGYIQSNYTQLPPGHSKLVPYYLGKFVAGGEVSMLSPDRFALRRSPPSPPPTPPHAPNPNPNSSPRRSSSCPHTPRRRGRPPKRKRAAASGSAVGLKLPPWPRSSHHVTDANAPPPPRRGRGRPRKNPENAVHSKVKALSATELVPRPRLVIRLQSRPSNPIPDTFAGDDVSGMRDGITRECDSRNVDGLRAAQRNPDEKSFPANARKKKESPPCVSALPASLQLELKEALLRPALPPAAWQKAEPGEEPVLPAQLLSDETSLPPVSLHSETEVEMLLLDQMQPEPEGALLLPQPEPELLPLAPKQPKSSEEQSLLTPLHPETKGKQCLSLPATMLPESKEDSPPATWPDAEPVVLPASVHLAPGLLQIDVKELKEECLSSSSIQPKFDESYFPLVSVHPEPCKELLILDTMQPKLDEEFLQLLPLQSDIEEEFLLLLAPIQSELHEEPILSISTQPELSEQPALPAPLKIALTEDSSHLALQQPEPTEETSLRPEPDEGSFQTARLLSEPKEEPLLLPAMPLAAIEPEGMEESCQSAPVTAMEKGEKGGHSSKHRRAHAKHRRLWFEC